MDRARAAHLIPRGLAGDEADEAEDLSDGDPGPDFREANARHGGDPKAESQSSRSQRVRPLRAATRSEKRNPYEGRVAKNQGL